MRTNQQKKIKKRAILVLVILCLVVLGITVVKGGRYIPAIFQLFFQKDVNLKTSEQNRINILILGVGGGVHDGPNLTDTIIFASVDQEKKKVNLTSIPRDLWMPELKAKINTAYAVGDGRQEGGGIKLAKASVSHLLGQQIDYVVRIDFDGFVKAVDLIGGLDIVIDNTLDDPQYPLTGRENDSCGLSEEKIASLAAEIATGSATEDEAFPCRYEHLIFEKGEQKMDGINALKFVRSRHAEGFEGSDFARSKRQEKVIAAFRDKVLSVDTFLSPVKVVNLISVLSDSIDTDIKEDEYDDFVKLAQKMKGATIKSSILDIGDTSTERLGLLIHPDGGGYNGQYVLIPRAGNGYYAEIQKYILCEIENGNCIVTANGIQAPTPTPTKSVKK